MKFKNRIFEIELPALEKGCELKPIWLSRKIANTISSPLRYLLIADNETHWLVIGFDPRGDHLSQLAKTEWAGCNLTWQEELEAAHQKRSL